LRLPIIIDTSIWFLTQIDGNNMTLGDTTFGNKAKTAKFVHSSQWSNEMSGVPIAGYNERQN